MTPKEVIQSVQDEQFEDVDGEPFSIELDPGFSQEGVKLFEARLHQRFETEFSHPLPEEIRELLRFTTGFRFAPIGEVDFTGEDFPFGHEIVFPLRVPICGDGFGNFWIVDINSRTGEWAPVLFDCHDPPVIVYQAGSFAEFLMELFKLGRPTQTSQIDFVCDEACFQIWRKNPGVIPASEARHSSDPIVNEFAKRFADADHIVDLRKAEVGQGFSWGRYGPDTEVVRHESELILGIKASKKKGVFKRLFGM